MIVMLQPPPPLPFSSLQYITFYYKILLQTDVKPGGGEVYQSRGGEMTTKE